MGVLVALSVTPASASARPAASQVQEDPATRAGLAEGDDLHRRLRPLEALERFQEILRRDSTEVEALWRASREAVNLGMLTGDPEARKEWYASAVQYGHRATRFDEANVDGWVWLAIALGRSALDEGPRTRVRLADEMHAAAVRALALDSTAAAAHHVLGEWHAEIRRLSGLTRFAARTLLGAGTFDQASWDEAEAHLRRAVELEPGGLIHRLALARLLLDRDRGDEARVQLQQVLERPAAEPTDARHKQEAQELLRRMG
jgi:tetratricopeptide (TPR) repeat protein